MDRRSRFFDLVKGLGICCVFLGHEFPDGLLWRTIFIFHMPLFFLLSGFFFRPERMDGWRDLALRQFRGILLPTLVFMAFGAAVYAIFGDLVSNDHDENVKRLLSFWFGLPFVLLSAWFSLGIIWSRFLLFVIDRVRLPRLPGWCRTVLILLLLFALGHVCSKSLDNDTVPLRLTAVPMCAFFMFLGGALRNGLVRFECVRIGYWKALLAAMGLLALTVTAAAFGGRPTNFCIVQYSKTLMFLLGSISGIMMALFLGKALECGPLGGLLSYVGRNSLVFFLAEWIAIKCLFELQGWTGIGYGHNRGPWWWSILASACTLAFAAAVSWVYRFVRRVQK